MAAPVVSQDIHVDLATRAVAIDIEATLELDSATSTFEMFRPFAPVTEATLDGQPIVFTPHRLAPDVLDVGTVATPVGPGLVRLVYRIEGVPTCPAPSNPSAALCWRGDDRTIFTPSGPGSAWYYVDVFGSSYFTGSVNVRAPTDETVRAGQDVAAEIEDHGDGTTTWTFDVALETSLLALYAGRLEEVRSSDGFAVIAHRADQAPRDAVQETVDRASRAIPALESFLGPYPAAEAHLVTVPRNFAFGGMGMHATIFIADYIFGPFRYILDAGVIHEFAHTYWAHRASGSDDAAAFFSEGFAEYSAWRAIEVMEGEARRRSGVRMNSVWYMFGRPSGVDAPIVGRDTGQSPAYVFVTYHKASSVLRMFEHLAGRAAFDGALAALLELGPGGLTLDAFVNALLKRGFDANHDVVQWLRRDGYPRITASFDDGQLTIDVDGPWTLSLPLVVEAFDGTVRAVSVPVSGGRTVLDVGNDIAQLDIDPDWTHVRDLRTAGGDVTLDGVVDAADLMAVALGADAAFPAERRRDGHYDPLLDLNDDRRVDFDDLSRLQGP